MSFVPSLIKLVSSRELFFGPRANGPYSFFVGTLLKRIKEFLREDQFQ